MADDNGAMRACAYGRIDDAVDLGTVRWNVQHGHARRMRSIRWRIGKDSGRDGWRLSLCDCGDAESRSCCKKQDRSAHGGSVHVQTPRFRKEAGHLRLRADWRAGYEP